MQKTNKLSEFFEQEHQSQNKILIIDTHNLIYRNLFIGIQQVKDDEIRNFSYWKYLIINSLFSTIKYHQPTRVIFTIDSKNSWRKQIYDGYKINRKKYRDDSPINFEKFFPICDTFLKEMQMVFCNMVFIKVDMAEGDDLIYYFAKKYQGNDVTIISMDTDLLQLLILSGIKIYDPIKRKYMENLNPKQALELKVIMGDKSDDIPAIVPKCGPVKAKKILEEGLDTFLSKNAEAKAAWERNRILIDFSYIPQNLLDNIESEYSKIEAELKEFNSRKCWEFLIANKINKFTDDFGLYENYLKNIK